MPMTPADRARLIDGTFADTIALHEQVRHTAPGAILAAADLLSAALRGGHAVLACGNGGSAADAQHFAAELVGRFTLERRAWPVMALTTDTSILTAIGNDYAFDRVFARQVEAHGRPGGVLVAISTSGSSRNVCAAIDAARHAGMKTLGLTGKDGGAIGRAVDVHLNVPGSCTARVQEAHCTLLHILCDLVERDLTSE
jgi:phosphoheptose isomerase